MNYKTTKTLSIVSAMILTLVIILTVVLSACSVPVVIPPVPEPNEIEQPVYDGALTEKDEEIEQDKVYELSESITFLNTSADSNTLNKGINLSATVLPENATSTDLDWSVVWKTSDSRYNEEFNNTNPILDYATITPNAENTHLAVLVCLKAFPVPIELKVQSRTYDNKNAVCQLDFAKKIIDFYASIKVLTHANRNSQELMSVNTDSSENLIMGLFLGYTSESIVSISSSGEYSVGTLLGTSTVSAMSKMNSSIYVNYISGKISANTLPTENINKMNGFQNVNNETLHSDFCSFLFTEKKLSKYLVANKSSSRWNDFIKATEAVTNDIIFSITISNGYSSKTKEFYSELNLSAMNVAISSISVSAGNGLVFQ